MAKENALNVAAKKGDLSTVNALLADRESYQLNIDAIIKDGASTRTALMQASANNQL